MENPNIMHILFKSKHSPHLLKGSIPKRSLKEILRYEDNPILVSAIYTFDLKREENPFIGAIVVGVDIYVTLSEWLKDNEGEINVEKLMAIIGSIGGQECVNGIINTVRSIVNDTSPDRSREKFALELLGITYAESEDEEQYVIGEQIDDVFSYFCETAISENEVSKDKLRNLSSEITSKINTDDYWKTSFSETIKESPKELSALFHKKFEKTFHIYCNFPYERVYAFGFAVKLAINLIKPSINRQKALSILTEFGLRTAHYKE